MTAMCTETPFLSKQLDEATNNNLFCESQFERKRWLGPQKTAKSLLCSGCYTWAVHLIIAKHVTDSDQLHWSNQNGQAPWKALCVNIDSHTALEAAALV